MAQYPRLSGKCVMYSIPRTVASLTSKDNYVLTRKATENTVDYILNQGGIKGDVVHFESIASYRNEGIFMFDGNTLVKLNFEIDDYGCVPPYFTPVEDNVPLLYWTDSIDHNSIVWVKTSTIRDNIIMKPKYGCIPGTDINRVYCIFTYNRRTYTIINSDDFDDVAMRNQILALNRVIGSDNIMQAFSVVSPICKLKNALFVGDEM